MEANKSQVGGTHYIEAAKGGEQHWDMMWRLFREEWFIGSITKYVLRYRKKNGIEDLKKAKHYLEKLIELEKEALINEIRNAPPDEGVKGIWKVSINVEQETTESPPIPPEKSTEESPSVYGVPKRQDIPLPKKVKVIRLGDGSVHSERDIWDMAAVLDKPGLFTGEDVAMCETKLRRLADKVGISQKQVVKRTSWKQLAGLIVNLMNGAEVSNDKPTTLPPENKPELQWCAICWNKLVPKTFRLCDDCLERINEAHEMEYHHES
jgi:hypothetical protein